ncbi:amidohydrolase family protein [Desulfogranum japonicum]|uniref:amidohydrolase family protein n=1 Tax=Desulfogranum japonicum TaxID=231447 RepID=UPI00040B185F|nr:amidohydrolase family protein [Desulfogranum japonicum]
MARYIDIHTHAFPDEVASTAIPALERSGNVKAYLDGTISDLLKSMDKAEIQASAVCLIATRPQQYKPILEWCESIRTPRIIPFPSVHPKDPHVLEHVQEIHTKGFKGIKLHPYYQDFFMDDPFLADFYQLVSELGLLLVIHCGYDIAYPRIRRSDPMKILDVVEQWPNLRLITTHLGGWDEWKDVRDLLTGKPIYMELSFALDFLDQIRLRDILLNHPKEYLLFGSDSPWADQATTLKMLGKLGLPDDLFQAITYENSARLLELCMLP